MAVRHPDDLADYVDGYLNPDQALRVERHLAGCDLCRQRVAAERALIERLRSVKLDAAHHQHLMNNLLSLAEPVRSAPVAPRPVHGLSIVPASAPPQYASARRSLGVAMVAVAGCVGATMVALHAPGVGATGVANVRLAPATNVTQMAPTLPGPTSLQRDPLSSASAASQDAIAVLNAAFPR